MIARKTHDDRISVALRLAKMILRDRGELKVNELAALPNISTEDEVNAVLSHLQDEEDVEVTQRKVSATPMLRWERVVRLRPKVR